MSNDTVRASATALPKSRRAALALFASAAAIAGLPATSIPAGLQIDPIFAAIRRHNEAWHAFNAACLLTDEIVAKRVGREVTEADEAAWSAALQAEEDAFEALIALPPVTIPGFRAALNYFNGLDTDGIEGASGRLLTALLASPILAIGRA
jgi:hypothetical protein